MSERTMIVVGPGVRRRTKRLLVLGAVGMAIQGGPPGEICERLANLSMPTILTLEPTAQQHGPVRKGRGGKVRRW